MKKKTRILTIGILFVASVTLFAETGIFSSASGLVVGASPVTKLCFFHGCTPAVQQANTVTPRAALQTFGLIASGGTDPYLTPTFLGDLTITDAKNVILGSTTGTKIGTATTQKLAFYNATPVVQQTSTTTAYTALVNEGIIASGGQDYSVQHVTVPLSAANIIAMYTTPVQLVATPGAGKSISVTKLLFTITRTSTAFTGGAAAIVQYDSTANGAGTQALDSTLASTVITGSAGTSVSARNGAVISDLASTSIQNKGLFISNGTAVFAAGTGTAVVDVWYVVQ